MRQYFVDAQVDGQTLRTGSDAVFAKMVDHYEDLFVACDYIIIRNGNFVVTYSDPPYRFHEQAP